MLEKMVLKLNLLDQFLLKDYRTYYCKCFICKITLPFADLNTSS